MFTVGPLSPGVSSPVTIPTSDLPGTPIADCSEAGDEDRPMAPLGPWNTVLLFDSTSSSGSYLPKIGTSFEV